MIWMMFVMMILGSQLFLLYKFFMDLELDNLQVENGIKFLRANDTESFRNEVEGNLQGIAVTEMEYRDQGFIPFQVILTRALCSFVLCGAIIR